MSDLSPSLLQDADLADAEGAASRAMASAAEVIAAASAPNAALPAATHLTPAGVVMMRDVFHVLDESRRGRIDARDLPVALALADLDVSADERTGLLAVHCADATAGVTEAEFLSICDVVAGARAGQPRLAPEQRLRDAFDVLANNDHGVVPIGGVLSWGADVMRACDECLLAEHGFDYSDALDGDDGARRGSRATGMAGAASARSMRGKRSSGGLAARGGSGARRSSAREGGDVYGDIPVVAEGHATRDAFHDDDMYDDDDDDAAAAARTLSFDDRDAMGAPASSGVRLRRRASGARSARLAPSAPARSPRLTLPEVAARQRAAAAERTGSAGSAPPALAGRRAAAGAELVTQLGATETAHVFTRDDVAATTNWLLGTLAARYRESPSESEKREIEMLLELARAAGANVNSVSAIMTRDAFVKLLRDAAVPVWGSG
jgi:Ca2+-binding EF-hand superfamily protein